MRTQNFSAIVGPNGSGKSNVIDALLFVFGKRAKQIRMSKVRATAAAGRQQPPPCRCYPQRLNSFVAAPGLATHP